VDLRRPLPGAAGDPPRSGPAQAGRVTVPHGCSPLCCSAACAVRAGVVLWQHAPGRSASADPAHTARGERQPGPAQYSATLGAHPWAGACAGWAYSLTAPRSCR
jgi:hypothetical protein